MGRGEGGVLPTSTGAGKGRLLKGIFSTEPHRAGKRGNRVMQSLTEDDMDCTDPNRWPPYFSLAGGLAGDPVFAGIS